MSACSVSKTDAEIKQDASLSLGKRETPPETADERRIRRIILLAFWSVVIFLGLPLWVWTTTVYRAELPIGSMKQWNDGEACRLTYTLHVTVKSHGQSEEALKRLEHDLFTQLNSQESPDLYHYSISANPVSADHEDLIVTFNQEDISSPTAKVRSHGRHLDVTCDTLSPACIAHAAQQVRSIFANEQAAIQYLLQTRGYHSHLRAGTSSLANTHELEQRSIRAFKYASSYHLTFSLFAASATPSAWDIDLALEHYLQPLLQSLSSVSNFTVDTQVQLHSAISPSIEGPLYDAATATWQLQQSDLSGFINAAEWPLSPSIDGGSTINFVLYIPPADRSPLLVAKTDRNSWVIPQWGGVQILNRAAKASDALDLTELGPIMYTFADQLTALVGLPPQPLSLQLRIDGLTRERLTSLIISASSTLGALHKLTRKLQSIAIPTSVARSVNSAIDHLGQACALQSVGKFQAALEHARAAENAAEHAFFEPSMVGQVYFPDEHKVAVYVPLLGPMAVPLLMATFKEFKEWRTSKMKTS